MALNDQRLQILLKEYETGTQEVSSVASRLWQYTAIIAVIAAGLAAFASQSGLLDDVHDGKLDWQIVALASLAIIFSLEWMSVFWSHQHMQDAIMFRMREIEKDLGMRKHRYVRAVCDLKGPRDKNASTVFESEKLGALTGQDELKKLSGAAWPAFYPWKLHGHLVAQLPAWAALIAGIILLGFELTGSPPSVTP